jgi:peptide/nickel transport system permease protein
VLAYILRRIVLLVPVFIGLSSLVFAIGRLLPGDPAALAAGPNASRAEVAALAHELGLDQPLWHQYLHYMKGLASGDWGMSIFTRQSVLSDLMTFLPATLELVLAALLLAIMLGIPAGLLAGVYRDKWPDYLCRSFSIGAVSMPRFFLGVVLQLGLAIALGWLPLSGRFPLTMEPPARVTGFLTIDSILAGDPTALWTALQYLALPAIATCASPLASILRMMRASTIEVLQQDYITTARALGLSRRIIVGKYVLKNAISSTLTVIGLYVGWLLGGTVLVETVFDWPGIGLYATKSIVTQDFTPVMGVTLAIGFVFVSTNLLVDLLYGWVNPKVRMA